MYTNSLPVQNGSIYPFPAVYRRDRGMPRYIKAKWILVILAAFLFTGIWQSVQAERLLRDSREVSAGMQTLHDEQDRLAKLIPDS